MTSYSGADGTRAGFLRAPEDNRGAGVEDNLSTMDPAAASPRTPTADETINPGTMPVFDKVAVLGNALWLMTQSGAHKYILMEDLEKFLVPPVALQQYRLWRNDNVPVAFASWALLNEEGEARLRDGIFNLREEDWNAGDQFWLTDIVAPFGGLDEAAAELKQVIFKDKTVKTLRAAPGGGIAVVEW